MPFDIPISRVWGAWFLLSPHQYVLVFLCIGILVGVKWYLIVVLSSLLKNKEFWPRSNKTETEDCGFGNSHLGMTGEMQRS